MFKYQFMLDVESDGPCPGLYSMVSFALVAMWDTSLTFRAETAPITDQYNEDALAISEITRQQHEAYPAPDIAMKALIDWLATLDIPERSRKVIWSDNPAFDWQFLNYYLHRFHGENPFGHSARRVGDLYAGFAKTPDATSKWKKWRVTAHTHDPLDDAMGNAEALKTIVAKMS